MKSIRPLNNSNKYISTTVLKDNSPLHSSLKTLVSLGYNNIELGSTHPYEKNIMKILETFDCHFLVHNYFPTPEQELIVNICSADDSLREKSIEHIERRIIFSSEINAGLFTFHPGYISEPISTNIDNQNWDFVYDRNKNQPLPYEEAFELIIIAVKRFVKIAEEYSQPIAIETTGSIAQKDNLLMQKSSEYRNLFNEVDSNLLGINLNFGHLNLASKAFNFSRFGFIDNLKEKIFAFEISHNDREKDDHKLLKSGEWYWEVIEDKKFKNIPMIYEGRETTLINFEALWNINNQ